MSEALSGRLHGYYRWHAHIYDATRWAFLFGRRSLIIMAAKRIRPRRILEVGCGTGVNLVQLARTFPEANVVGLDLSAAMLAKARTKVGMYGSRVRLLQCQYDSPISRGDPFDLIVFSYCLTMINPGFADILRISLQDLAPQGYLAVVDFHETSFVSFGRWMGLNHVRMEGQVLAALQEAGLQIAPCGVTSAYFGLWRWFSCLARR